MVSSWNWHLTISLGLATPNVYIKNTQINAHWEGLHFEITNGLFLVVFCTMWCLSCLIFFRHLHPHTSASIGCSLSRRAMKNVSTVLRCHGESADHAIHSRSDFAEQKKKKQTFSPSVSDYLEPDPPFLDHVTPSPSAFSHIVNPTRTRRKYKPTLSLAGTSFT
jgi:hypothetical protein